VSRILYLECGRASDKAFLRLNESLEMIPEFKFSSTNLLRFDVLIIPSYSNQDFLKKQWNRIDQFVSLGGTVILLGAVQDKTEWFPKVLWHKERLDSVIVRNQDDPDTRAILGSLVSSQDKLRFHDTFVSHGFLTTDWDCAKPILTGDNPNHLVISLIEFKKKDGAILATTLDPDFHSISGYTKNNQKENENAWLLLKNLVSWAKSRAEQKGVAASVIRRLTGLSREVATLFALLLFLIICAASTIGVALQLVDERLFQNIAAAASVISLSLTIFLFKVKGS